MAEVLFDGSSHVQGHGDERGMGGYRGRIQYAYELYQQKHIYPHTKAGMPGGRGVSLHDRSMAGKTLFEINATLPQQVDLLRDAGRKGDLFGVFDIGLYWQNRPHEVADDSLAWWEQELDTLRGICGKNEITPIVVGSPLPMPESVWLNGWPTMPEVLGKLALMTVEHTSDWVATYVSSEEVLAADKSAYMSPDGLHLNSDGYARVARAILPHLNSTLDIPNDQVPLPEC